MRNKRYSKRSYLGELILNHVKANKKDYFILAVVLIIGVFIGVILVNNSNQENSQEIQGYINGFVDGIKKEEYRVDKNKLLISSVLSNLKIALILWIAGTTIIGIPVVYGQIGYKGFCIGYTISSIIASLGKSTGVVFAIGSLLMQNLVAIPCFLAISVSSMKIYRNIIYDRNKESNKSEIIRHTVFSLIMAGGLIISSLIEIFVSTNITNCIVTNFI